MRQVRYNDEDFYLFTHAPNWEAAVKMKLFMPSSQSKGRSNREAARPRGETVRVSLFKYSTWIEGRDLKEIVQVLRTRTTERILVPVWVDDVADADELAVFDAGIYLSIETNPNEGYYNFDESQWTLHSTRTNHGLTGAEVVTLPVMICDFKEYPDADCVDDEFVDYTFSFEEDAEYEYALSKVSSGTCTFDEHSVILMINGAAYSVSRAGNQIVLDYVIGNLGSTPGCAYDAVEGIVFIVGWDDDRNQILTKYHACSMTQIEQIQLSSITSNLLVNCTIDTKRRHLLVGTNDDSIYKFDYDGNYIGAVSRNSSFDWYDFCYDPVTDKLWTAHNDEAISVDHMTGQVTRYPNVMTRSIDTWIGATCDKYGNVTMMDNVAGGYVHVYNIPAVLSGNGHQSLELGTYAYDRLSDAAADPRFENRLTMYESNYPVFPLTPNYESSQKAGSVDLLIRSRRVGQYRRLRKDYYDALPAREMALRYDTCTHQEAKDLIEFWIDRKGVVERFYISSQIAPAQLVKSGGGTVLEVDDSTYFSVGQLVGFEVYRNDNKEEELHLATITQINGNELTFDRNLSAFPIYGTSIREMILCSFEKSFMNLTWDTDQSFSTTLEMVERVPEVNEDEVPGLSVGALNARTSLYTLTDERGNIYRYTDYERDLVYNGDTFTTYPISHSAIELTINLKDSTTLKVDAIPGSPFVDFFNVNSGTTLRLSVLIQRVQFSDTGVAQSLKRSFRGELSKPKLMGNKMSFRAQLLSRDLDNRIPRLRHQRVCNYVFGSTGCGVDLALHRYDATVTSIDISQGYVNITGLTRHNGLDTPSAIASMIEGGVLEAGGQTWLILKVVGTGVNSYGLYLGSNENYPDVGATVMLQAECSGSNTACTSYANYNNFGGHLVADGNLSLVSVSADVSGGGKK